MMKCDELKTFDVGLGQYCKDGSPCVVAFDSDQNPRLLNEKVYLKSDVDAAIAELKQKLEDAKATAYAESVDAGMENRRLKRALWLARAYRGRDNSILLPSKFMRNVWDNVERKCLKKAEQYK